MCKNNSTTFEQKNKNLRWDFYFFAQTQTLNNRKDAPGEVSKLVNLASLSKFEREQQPYEAYPTSPPSLVNTSFLPPDKPYLSPNGLLSLTDIKMFWTKYFWQKFCSSKNLCWQTFFVIKDFFDHDFFAKLSPNSSLAGLS